MEGTSLTTLCPPQWQWRDTGGLVKGCPGGGCFILSKVQWEESTGSDGAASTRTFRRMPQFTPVTTLVCSPPGVREDRSSAFPTEKPLPRQLLGFGAPLGHRHPVLEMEWMTWPRPFSSACSTWFSSTHMYARAHTSAQTHAHSHLTDPGLVCAGAE